MNRKSDLNPKTVFKILWLTSKEKQKTNKLTKKDVINKGNSQNTYIVLIGGRLTNRGSLKNTYMAKRRMEELTKTSKYVTDL